MNYIYDIVLNFQDHYYQFFEWHRKDKIKNITKIPVYRVSDKDIMHLKNNKIQIDSQLLNRIKEENKKYKKIMCLVSNTKISLGLLFDEQGNLQKRSSLIFEEEDEVNDFVQDLPITKIKYLKNTKIQLSQDKLRLEIEKKDILLKYIDQTSDILTLKYLYYEYFKEECDSIAKIKKSLQNELEKNWTKKQNNLYHVVNLLNKKNLPTK